MGHIDYTNVSSLDALIDVSDAAARACLVRLREQLERLVPDVEPRVVMDGLHKKPALAYYRGDDVILHVYPEPGVMNGLHVSLPLRVSERDLIDTTGIDADLAQGVQRAAPRHHVLYVERTLHSPRAVDDLMLLLARRVDILPKRLH